MGVKDNSYDEMLAKQQLGRPSYDSFDAYVAAHPEGEYFRRWLTEDGKLGLVIVPCFPNWCGLPGDYFWAYMGREYRKAEPDEIAKGISVS